MNTVLVIRKDDEFSSTLREAGFDVVDLELVETRPFEDLSELRERLSRLLDYDGVFFTSPVAAEIFVKERNGSNGFDGDIYALGRRAQKVLEAAGLTVKTVDEANTADEMLAGFGDEEFTGKRYLFVRGERSLRTVPERLSGRATVDEVAVYSTVVASIDRKTIDNIRARLLKDEIDFVCFFSPSGVERFIELFSNGARNVKAAAIGITTADSAEQAGINVSFISPRSSADDFARGLIDHIKNIE